MASTEPTPNPTGSSASVPVAVPDAPARNDALIRPVASLQVQLELQTHVENLIKSVLKVGVDYGRIPGASKRVLFKPGAEKLCLAYGAAAVFELVEREVDHVVERPWQKLKKVENRDGSFTWNVTGSGTAQGLYRYHYRCKIMVGDRVIGVEEGTCSTLEAKYCDRPHECENTVMKMAQKRAYVGAVLRAFALSGRFDVGDDEPRSAPQAAVKYNGTKAEREQLDAHLGETDVPREFWDEVHAALCGQPRDRCGAVIAAVLKKHEEPRK